MIKKGDTLVEVTIAIGIFSLIAIAVASVMNSSTSGAQLSLETTLAREEIDTQAEALRFVQNTYASSKESSEQNLSDLWETITDHAVDLTDLSADDAAAIVQYTPMTCSELYDDSNPAKNYAFVLNPRTLNTGSGAYIRLKDADNPDNEDKFVEASTYPRLIFGDSTNNSGNAALDDNNTSLTNLYRAEGIYVIAVRDPDSTRVIDITGNIGTADDLNAKASAYFDFYIRTCWYASGNNQPSTISTVIRLHDSGIISELGWVEVTYHASAFDGGINKTERQRYIKVDGAPETRVDETFKGWCTVEPITNCVNDGGELRKPDDIIINRDSGEVKSVDLYEYWASERYTIVSMLNGAEIGRNYCYLDASLGDLCVVPAVPTSESGFTNQGWCNVSPPTSNSNCDAGNLLTAGDPISESSFTNKTMNIYLGRTMSKQYLQDFTKADCKDKAQYSNYTLYDKRDETTYTVRYISSTNTCWMTQDLHITGRIHNEDHRTTNMDRDTWNLHTGETGDYHTAGSTTLRSDLDGDYVLYNFCATTADTPGGCTPTAKYTSGTDICPYRWRLPTGDEMSQARTSTAIFPRPRESDNSPGWWTSTGFNGNTDGSKRMCTLYYEYLSGDYRYSFNNIVFASTCAGQAKKTNRQTRLRIRCIHK